MNHLPVVDSESSEHRQPVVIPHRELSAEAFRGVVESFILREGTDYGEKEFSLDQKIAQVMAQIDQGEARILFDPESETVDIVRRSQILPQG